MLARSRSIKLAGAEIETPLLVPAISSKALGPIQLGQLGKKDPVLKPASQVHTDVLIPSISEAVLISAYDIHHRFVNDARAFETRFPSSAYAQIKVMFIDSGWYEKSVGLATGQWYHEVGDQPLRFEEQDYAGLVDSLDKHISAVLVSWDNPGAYGDQIKAAQGFFGARKRFSSDLLLKPSRTRRYHDFNELSGADAKRLQAFNVVGVTEKELGESLLDRLEYMAEFAQTAAALGITQYVNRPNYPKGQGRVERSFLTDDLEFHQVEDLPHEVAELNVRLAAWNHVYEEIRPHAALGYLTPNAFYAHWLKDQGQTHRLAL